MEISQGSLLGGQVRYDQPVDGFRTGIEPVLLAAAIPAKPGDTVLEAGTGAGAAMLCLSHRVPGCHITAVERDSDMAALAGHNLAQNAMAHIVRAADILEMPVVTQFDHAMANPPWHRVDATPSPSARRDAAKRAPEGLYAAWATALALHLRPRGTLTLILPTARLELGLAAMMGAGMGSLAMFPFWPRLGQPSKLAILRGVRGGAGPFRLLPGLTLHGDGNTYSAAAKAVLRDGAAIEEL